MHCKLPEEENLLAPSWAHSKAYQMLREEILKSDFNSDPMSSVWMVFVFCVCF